MCWLGSSWTLPYQHLHLDSWHWSLDLENILKCFLFFFSICFGKSLIGWRFFFTFIYSLRYGCILFCIWLVILHKRKLGCCKILHCIPNICHVSLFLCVCVCLPICKNKTNFFFLLKVKCISSTSTLPFKESNIPAHVIYDEVSYLSRSLWYDIIVSTNIASKWSLSKHATGLCQSYMGDMAGY